MCQYTNKYNLPDRVIRQLLLPYQPKEHRYSATQLIDAPLIRTLMLEKWDDIVYDYSDFLETIVGASVHERQERLATDDEQAEHKIEVVVDGQMVVGKSDNYENGIIRDTKTTKVGYLKYNKKKLEQQLNIYAYLWRQQGKEVTALEGDLYYKNWDWKTPVFKPDMDYPKILYENVKVDLWTLEQQEEFIKDQLEYHNLESHSECTDEEKWTTSSTFAVMKRGDLTGRAKRVVNTYQEAQDYIQYKKLKDVEIVERKGGNLRCRYFCVLGRNKLCPFWKNNTK